jgi:transposase
MDNLQPLHRRVAGIDVHRMQHAVTVLLEQQDGQIQRERREFGGFHRDVRALAGWLAELKVERVILESTGIYWRSVYVHLERAGLQVWLVNAYAVKHVPGRKTDLADSEWLATLGRFGLVRPSFIPPQDLRELRLVSRYRQKVVGMRSSEINRLHKWLDDCSIKLGGVVSDLEGVSARAMVDGLLEGRPIAELLPLARGNLKKKLDDLEAALEGEMTPRHRLVMRMAQDHIQHLDDTLLRIDAYLLNAMAPYRLAHQLLQTIPGIDAPAAAQILIEIGDDMQVFQTPARLASWAGLCPGNHESAGKRKSGRTRRANPIIRYLLCECASAASRTHSSLRAWFKQLNIRRSYKKCIVALAHKMIRLIFILIDRKTAYIDPQTDYAKISATKNAPRWIRHLKQIGRWPKADPQPQN